MNALNALAAAVVLAVSVGDVPNPHSSGGWVTDMAGVLGIAEETAMNEMIQALHDDLTVEIAVVTVVDVDGTPKSFATALFNSWGIGDAQANNGLLVLLVMGERRLEMETGYGLEATLPDGWLGSMQQRSMVPLFKQGAYGAGLVAGLTEINARLRRSPDEAREGASAPAHVQSTRSPPLPTRTRAGDVVPVLVLMGFLALALLFVAWRKALTARWRKCPECGVDRELLDEDADDEHLSEGQETEEMIGSVNYDVWTCLDCGSVGVRRRNRLFSGFSKCVGCGFKTVRKTSTVISAATTMSTGTARVTVSCSHCDLHETYTRTIPKVSTSSSSSSSSSSWSSSSGGSWSSGGFGGGSSGGGGAGSSW